MIEGLDQRLEAYAESDYYPFHMPGHKRISQGLMDAYKIDITEIDGFDNLHGASEILLEAQNRAAALYDSDKSYYLINGSTCGILAAISAATGKRKKIIMARNCHKAVYHAAYLMELTTVYLQPKLRALNNADNYTENVKEYALDIQGEITIDSIKEALQEHPDAAAVVITSPTYEGIISDVEGIAKLVHSYDIPLIVDEAHGAHFGFHHGFPQTAVRLGADLVIQSMHKVLPSLTQTALLHVNSKYVSVKKVEKFLGVYETSSPSYVLMAGMERCIRLLAEKSNVLFHAFYEKLVNFYARCEELKHIQLMPVSIDKDASKLVISVKNTTITGKEFYDILLNKYHLQMEMASEFYVLAMTSIMDTQEGFERLYQALAEIDKTLKFKSETEYGAYIKELYNEKQKAYEMFEAEDYEAKEVSFEEAIGKVSKDTIFLYPPGIPVLLPGEIIEEAFIKNIRKCKVLRLNLQGVADIINERINIVNF